MKGDLRAKLTVEKKAAYRNSPTFFPMYSEKPFFKPSQLLLYKIQNFAQH
jgi:hypothetical protein